MARLQSEFWHEHFLGATNFVTKNAPKFTLNFLSLYFVGPKKSPPKKQKEMFPSGNLKKNYRRASADAQGQTKKKSTKSKENRKTNKKKQGLEGLKRGSH